MIYDQRPRQVDFEMAVGAITESVNVAAEAPILDMKSSETGQTFTTGQQSGSGTRTRDEVIRRESRAQELQQPSVNVQNLQRRAAGVLPVRIDVPRAGSSHRFVKPLVIDEETMVSFRYRRK